MFVPIRTDSRLRSTPYMNWLIIAANVIVFALQKPLHLDSRWVLQPTDPKLFTFISYAFLHAGALHIAGNMLFLYIFGNNVNDKMGNAAYLAFYLAGAVFAGAGFAMTSQAGIVGASGAVSAVTGAYLILFPRSSITIAYFFIFIGTIEVPSFYLIAFFFAKDLLFGISGNGETQGGGVAYLAHVTGTVYGAALSLILLWVRFLPRDQFDVLALLDRWNRRRQFRDVVASGYDPFNYVTPAKSRGKPVVSPIEERIADLRLQTATAVANHDLPQAVKCYLELRAIDPNQVLSRQAQLDVANQLVAQQLYDAAADAYELFIRAYPKFEQMEQVQLMLGLVYGRYLQKFDRARELLLQASAKLHSDREQELAREELARIDAASPLVR